MSLTYHIDVNNGQGDLQACLKIFDFISNCLGLTEGR